MNTIIRIERKSEVVCFSKQILKNKEVSYRAKGVFAHLMSLENGSTISVKEVMGAGPDGRDSLRSAFSELEEFGYIKREQLKDESGTMCGSRVVVYEESGMTPVEEVPKDDVNVFSRPAFVPKKRFEPPTIAQVSEYSQSIGFGSLKASSFVDYYEARGWRYGAGKTPMASWEAAVRTWKARDESKNKKDKLIV
jgi:hypothetical protein